MKHLLLLLLVALGGCASESYIKNSELMSLGTAAVITDDHGLVFGERCGGGGFNIGSPSDRNFLHVPGWTKDSRFFFMSLPAGTYSIAGIGSVHGAFEGKPPLEFTVVPSKAIYVGAIYPSWWRGGDGQEKCQYAWPRAVKSRVYELPTVIGPNLKWDVYVLDQRENAVRGIQLEHPNVDLSNSVTVLVK